MTPDDKIATTLDVVLYWVATWRKDGDYIGFTEGCFDRIHAGHISLLGQAGAGRRLVVGLNSDDSVRRLIQSESARAAALAALAAVDMVVPFAVATPLRLIEAIRPDVLVQGADYALDQVGADLVRSYGGRVVLVPLEPTPSGNSV